MRIFALDPGSANIGWAVLGHQYNVIGYGCIQEPADKSLSFNRQMNERLKLMTRVFGAFLDDFEITRVAWEVVTSASFKNRDHVVATAVALKVLTFQRDLAWVEYTPNTWHFRLTGEKKKTKSEIRRFVEKRVELPETSEKVPYDAYDAVGIGLVASLESEWSN